MKKSFKKDLDDVILEFRINGISSRDRDWLDIDIKIESPVISYNLKDWEEDGEILEYLDMDTLISLMDRWLEGSLVRVETFETLEPDLLLRFYPDGEKRIDFCICLQTKTYGFSQNYLVLPLEYEDALEFVEYWKKIRNKLLMK